MDDSNRFIWYFKLFYFWHVYFSFYLVGFDEVGADCLLWLKCFFNKLIILQKNRIDLTYLIGKHPIQKHLSWIINSFFWLFLQILIHRKEQLRIIDFFGYFSHGLFVEDSEDVLACLDVVERIWEYFETQFVSDLVEEGRQRVRPYYFCFVALFPFKHGEHEAKKPRNGVNGQPRKQDDCPLGKLPAMLLDKPLIRLGNINQILLILNSQ